MPDHELQTLVSRLREELEGLTESSPDARTRLDALATALEHRLEHPREDNQDEELIEDLGDAVTRLEVEHPRATGILNDILVALASIGI